MQNAILVILFVYAASQLEAAASNIGQCREICRDVSIQGPPGPPGMRGPPGASEITAEQAKLKIEVESRVDILTSFWHASTIQIQNEFKEQIARLENIIRELKEEIRNNREAFCPLRYKGKCYWAVFDDDVTFSDAEKLCARIQGGKPANVYDEKHYHHVVKYVRSFVTPLQNNARLWTGMKIDTEHDSVTFSDGKSPDYELKWRKNYPNGNLDYTAILLMARTDGNTKNEGFYNQSPDYGKPGVLCEV